MDVRSVAPGPSSSTEPDPAAISASIATLCGADLATSDRYEARNDALRSISRDRNLQEDDVAALTAWIASANDVLHTERLAALKNDVMNLVRRQESPPPDFADTLIAMFESGTHSPAVLDYCIQHLGAMLGDIADEAIRGRIRSLLVKAAGRINQPYAGTALYNLAFIAPLVAVFMLAAKGADAARMSRWSKRNVFPSKLALGVVFALLGFLVLGQAT